MPGEIERCALLRFSSRTLPLRQLSWRRLMGKALQATEGRGHPSNGDGRHLNDS